MKRSYALGVTAALLVGALAGAQFASGAGDSAPSAFISIIPCRLVDTRPASKVGPAPTFKADNGRAIQARGAQGNCIIPAKATAVSLNVTAVGGTANSFLTLWPSDASQRPSTANLNWVAGAPPTPNKVDVALSTDGRFSIYNRFGNVDVVVDVTGYYAPVVSSTGTVSAVDTVFQTINVKLNSTGDGSNGQAVAQCPAGMVALAGGIENPLQVPLNTRSSRPNPDPKSNAGDPTGWFGDVRSSSNSAAGSKATVYAVCITLNL
jgi:hypothetical protein